MRACSHRAGYAAAVTTHAATRTPDASGLLPGLYRRFQHLIHEIAKFGIVGAMCAVVDIGLSNVLHIGLGVGPLTSKLASTVVAATFAYVGNRYWSFRHRGRSSVRREYALFFLLNAVGLGITEACIGFSEYVLGLHSALAFNVSGNLVGLGLGTVFRFVTYRRFVFTAVEPGPGAGHADSDAALAAALAAGSVAAGPDVVHQIEDDEAAELAAVDRGPARVA